MATTIHPYKGYLNTLFHVHVSGTHDIEYHVILKSNNVSSEILKGSVSPNEPFNFQIPMAGEFSVECSDGTSIPLTVEDGYKYGGSSFKRAFIFDDCPWLFVIMYDRTYFYNRETKESYVEAISPDEITKISSEFVIFGNHKQKDRTIYSLNEQKPILTICDIIYTNEQVLAWCEKDNEKTALVVFSLTDYREEHRVNVDLFAIDYKSQRLVFSYNDTIETIALGGYFERELKGKTFPGTIVNIVVPNLAISYQSNKFGNFIFIYDIDKNKLLKEIRINGCLAQIGDTKLIDTWQRQQAIREFDINKTEFPEASITAEYYEFKFYPCEWDVFYTTKHIHIAKNSAYREDRKEEIMLHSFNRDLNQSLKSTFDHLIIYQDTICLYNRNESFVCNKLYSAAGYSGDGSIYTDNRVIYRYVGDSLYTLSSNGYWDNKRVLNISFEYFDTYNVVKNKDTNLIATLGGVELGKYECVFYPNDPYCRFLRTSENFIFPFARVLKRNIDTHPTCISESLRFAIDLKGDSVYIYTFNRENTIKEKILEDIFDYSEYKDVLFSENGNSIMHRAGDKTIIMNIANGRTETYENVSFVKQVNGIRPVFETPSALQPRLVNPVTKQIIDCKAMCQFQFISPDGSLYADTRLIEYVEYYWRRDNTFITNDEYLMLVEKYKYPWQEKRNSLEWLEVTELRKLLVQEHFDYLDNKIPYLLNNDHTGKQWNRTILDENNDFGVSHFLEYFIEKRGIAYIRNSKDDSISAKIELGEPLSYINYVSFSYDSKYVSIAGYRGDRKSSWGGLFLIYDLTKHSIITFQNTRRAVWVTAFSKSNALASYTSNPNTFFAKDEKEYDDFDNMLISGKNFLTFSPDGIYFALSEQGYISKYDRYGNINSGWGHQSSSLVEVRLSNRPDSCYAQFNDLSDLGIADVATHATCVASVSFSNDNERLMMVGKDGVVIIRNLHLGKHAE